MVPARETHSAPADACKLARNLAGYFDFRSSEQLRLLMKFSASMLIYKSNVSVETAEKNTSTSHRASSPGKCGYGFIQTERSFIGKPASVGVCCALRVGRGQLDALALSIIVPCRNRRSDAFELSFNPAELIYSPAADVLSGYRGTFEEPRPDQIEIEFLSDVGRQSSTRPSGPNLTTLLSSTPFSDACGELVSGKI
jgi:hypothetical protein